MVIRANNIEKTFNSGNSSPGFSLNIVEFEVAEGEIFTLLGPNGSGKSTLIKLLLNLIFLDNGSIQLFGRNHYEKESRRNVGYLPEEFSFPQNYKFKEILEIFSRLNKGQKCNIKNELELLCTNFELENIIDKSVSTLSKGMNQSLGLLNAIVGEKDLLILDEPFNGLDPNQKRKAMQYLKESNYEKGTTILLTTHILQDAQEFSTKISLINKGEILIVETIGNIIKKHNSLGKFYFNYI